MNMAVPLATSISLPCSDRKTTNAPKKSRKIPETRAGAVVHTDVAEVNVSSVGEAGNIVMFIDEAPGHLSACHMRTKREIT